jgi:replicative DNA helicase
MNCVPTHLLEELGARLPKAPPGEARKPAAKSFDIDAWIGNHRLEVRGPVAWNGGRKWVLNTCPWNSEHNGRSAFIVQFPSGAIAAGCLHKSCAGNDWAVLRNILEPGWRSNRGTGHRSEDAIESVWEPPIPFHQFELPSFPTDALPAWLCGFVEGLALATQTPVDLASMLVLSVVATACAKKVEVQVRADYLEPINVFTATALPSGTRKSTVFAAVTKPLDDYEKSEAARTNRENAVRRSRRKAKENTHNRLQERAATATGEEQASLVKEAEILAAELADADALLPTRLIADDCTPELLGTLLCANRGRIAVLSPEGDIFELLAGRYSPNKTPNFAVYLKGHAGDQLRIDRRERTEFVDKPALTVGLTVQPDVIRRLAEKHGFRERGLLGRFLYSMPKSLLGRRDTNPPPLPVEVRETYHRHVLNLLRLPMRLDERGDADPHILVLDPEARLHMQRFADWIEPQLSEFGDLGGMSDWSGKLYGAAARVAGILHMAEMATAAEPWGTPISAATAINAIRIAKYLIPHAKAAYSEMGADEEVTRAKSILRWIESQRCMSFTRRDLHQSMRATFKHVNDMERPLSVLATQIFIRARPEIHDGPGRPPSQIYDVNPLWFPQNAQSPQTTPVGGFEDCEDSEKHRAAPGSGLA